MFSHEFTENGDRFLAVFETDRDDHAGEYPVDIEFKMAMEDNRYWPINSSLLTEALEDHFVYYEFPDWLENERREKQLRRIE